MSTDHGYAKSSCDPIAPSERVVAVIREESVWNHQMILQRELRFVKLWAWHTENPKKLLSSVNFNPL